MHRLPPWHFLRCTGMARTRCRGNIRPLLGFLPTGEACRGSSRRSACGSCRTAEGASVAPKDRRPDRSAGALSRSRRTRSQSSQRSRSIHLAGPRLRRSSPRSIADNSSGGAIKSLPASTSRRWRPMPMIRPAASAKNAQVWELGSQAHSRSPAHADYRCRVPWRYPVRRGFSARRWPAHRRDDSATVRRRRACSRNDPDERSSPCSRPGSCRLPGPSPRPPRRAKSPARSTADAHAAPRTCVLRA